MLEILRYSWFVLHVFNTALLLFLRYLCICLLFVCKAPWSHTASLTRQWAAVPSALTATGRSAPSCSTSWCSRHGVGSSRVASTGPRLAARRQAPCWHMSRVALSWSATAQTGGTFSRWASRPRQAQRMSVCSVTTALSSCRRTLRVSGQRRGLIACSSLCTIIWTRWNNPTHEVHATSIQGGRRFLLNCANPTPATCQHCSTCAERQSMATLISWPRGTSCLSH